MAYPTESQLATSHQTSLKRKREPLDDGDESVEDIIRSNTVDGLGREHEAFDEQDDGDDEEYSNEPARFGTQVLPVADLPDDFSGEPQDGYEYLFTVRRAAMALPEYTKVINPFPTTMAIETPQVAIGPPTDHQAEANVPSSEWKLTFEKRFLALRKALTSLPNSNGGATIPHLKDRDAWWKFLNGDLKPGALPFEPKSQPMSTSNEGETTGAQLEVDPIAEAFDEGLSGTDSVVVQKVAIIDDSSSIEEGDVSERGDENSVLLQAETVAFELAPGYAPRAPSNSLLQKINTRTAFQLLMYFGHWLNVRLETHPSLETGEITQPPLSQNDARWIFFLLARLDQELSSDQISTLRILARSCLTLLLGSLKLGTQVFSPEISQARAGCWMIILAVAKGWGQLDLWEEAVSAVGK